ncbi:translation elongation factor Ts [Usitatibacter palustris]|uniref:Elongation factor Ts n=1 Tax=Usitatibacter palustris TaxID=2732487 RepID=A0A6M4H830_9PROT|nr:translation elongation factor Ts [Usitatibacter palustris]QJR14147.1 Elongation factor Ts [Usitatibacter palustris]
MAEITAGLVKELRELTGLGMMECKKALEEAGGDIKKAEELLRIKSGAKASKAAGRVAADGAIGSYLSPDAKLGALVEVNAETDFVAKNPDFESFTKDVAKLVAEKSPADVAALSALSIGGETVESLRQKLVQKIGENINVRRFERIQSNGKVISYIHPGAKVAVLVDLEGDEAVAKDVAMHIAFAKPQFFTKDQVNPDVVAAERKVIEARAAESGKPPEIVAKMVEGGINKFVGEITLLGQPFVKDDKQTVQKMLDANKAKLHGYRYLVVGQGIEKKQTDFAAEVAAMSKGNG